jgi:hypothetical protein
MKTETFDSGDEPFLHWMDSHPEGYVLNTKRSAASSDATFHRSGCRHISGLVSGQRPDAFTKHEYIKVCADTTGALVQWTREHRPNAVGEVTSCQTCEPEVEFAFELNPDEIADPETYPEGTTRTVAVNRYERSTAARRACLEHHGTACLVCNFDFAEQYGESIGAGFIHVHHEKPLAQTDGERNVDPVEDLKPVCPNCHAMLHKKTPPFTIDELRSRLRDER